MVRQKMLLDVDEDDIATWTHNIILLDETQKMCIECCHDIRFVGRMLFQWRHFVRVSFDCISPQKNDLAETNKEIEKEHLQSLDAVSSEDVTDTVGENEENSKGCVVMMDSSDKQSFTMVDDYPLIECFKPGDHVEEEHLPPQAKRGPGRPRKQKELNVKKKKSLWLYCNSCPRRFMKEHLLKIHEKTHDPSANDKDSVPKSSICPHCNGQFLGLKRHMELVHGTVSDSAGQKDFLCRFCPKMFSQKRRMLDHERIHTKEKPYVCLVCGLGFPRDSCLQKHVSIHTGEKKFKCKFCPRRFRQRGNQTIHERSVHKTVQYPCPNGCSKKFIFFSLLKKHIQQAECDIH